MYTHQETNEQIKDKLIKLSYNQDIDIAKKLLGLINGIIPRYIDLPENLSLFSSIIYLSCYQQSGNHYFINELPATKKFKKGRTIISLKDQSGHQINCLLRSILTDIIHQSVIHQNKDMSLEQMITSLNQSLIQPDLLQKDDFLTAVNCEINHENLMLKYISCGHPGFIIIRDNKVFILPCRTKRQGKNPPIAVMKNYTFSADTFQLRLGDKLIFYTEGLLKAGLPDENIEKGWKAVTNDELKHIIKTLISEGKMPVSKIINSLLHKIALINQKDIHLSRVNNSNDDITLIGMEIEDTKHFNEDIWYINNIEELQKKTNQFIKKQLNEWQKRKFSKPFRLQICFEEALVNAWVHGNKSNPQKPVLIRYRYGNDFHLEIIDMGKGFEMSKVPNPRAPENRFKETGRGLFMIKNYASRARWNDNGKRVTMTFKKYPNLIEEDCIKTAYECINLWK